MTKRGTLWTLAGSAVFASLVALMLGASTARTETTVSKGLVCDASFFFSFDRNEVIGDLVRVNGRGLLACKNDHGFSMEEPVIGDLELQVDGELPEGEIALSGNTSAFVIPRDSAQLQDLYRTRDFSWTAASMGDDDAKFVFRGVANDLVIEMKLNSNDASVAPMLGVRSLRLYYDDSAPDLTGY